MSRYRKDFGGRGEQAVVEYLAARNVEIVEQNYRCKSGEIDIIAGNRAHCLFFIEVKTRSSVECGRPIEAVNKSKRAKIVRAAKHYLLEKGLYEMVDVRFDIAEVFDDSPELRIDYYENAFIEGE